MPAPVLQFKRGNAGVAGTVPALRPGEPAISLNNFDFFIGIDTSVTNNKFFGSHRYWGREDGTNSLRFKLVDKDGSNYVAIKAPDTLAGIVTYTLPGTQGAVSSVLTNDGSGNLTWASGSANLVFTGIATFTDTTDNTLGNPDTGAVQIDGGLGVNKNVTVGAGLSVAGESYFIGTATFYGGQINLGDSDTDDIVVAGEFKSSLVPSDDASYDLGGSGKRWRNVNVSGITTIGSLVCNDGSTFTGSVQIDNNLNVNGNITLGGTSHYHAADELNIKDKDIVLGVTTDTRLYPDNSTDTTANHGGIAIASTEGSPLVSLYAAGIGTLPDTYKQLMWVRNGTWVGLGTDAWMFNYGVGIGSTQIPAGVRLAVGGVQVTDDTITASTGNFNNISATNITASLTGTATTANRALGVDVVGVATNQNYYITLVDGSGNAKSIGVDAELLYNPNTNVLSVPQITIGTGLGVTQFSSSVGAGTSTSSVPTSSAVIDYVGTQIGNIDLTLGISADTGGPSTVNTSQTLTISGTANEVETSVSGQTITVGLPDAVIVGTSLSAPTVRTNTIQSQNTGVTVLTLTADDAQVAGDLTVGGNLYVNGSTTQVNTSSLTVEDRTIQLGMVDGSAPSTSTTWDLGVLFNYFTDSAKQSAVIWEHGDSRFKFGSVVTDGGGTDNNSPQLTVSTFAPIEVGELWINNTCTGGAQQVIGCVGSELKLQNITVDAGVF